MRKVLVAVLLVGLMVPGSLVVHAQVGEQSIAQTAAANAQFSTLVEALEAAGLVQTLDADGSFTVFAPTNEAFAAALDALGMSQSELFADTNLLTQILLYHVVDGETLAADVAAMDSLTTEQGSDISVTASNNGIVLNDDVQVVQADIAASNGVIHAVNGVLLPPAVTDTETTAPQNLTYLRVTHLSPDAPAVELYIDGELSDFQVLEFGGISGWVELPAGSYNIALVPVGGSLEDAVIGPVAYTLNAGLWTTTAVIGSADTGTLTAQALRLDYGPLDAGMARVAVFHAIADAPAVDVVLADGTVLASGLAYAGVAADFNTGLATFEVPAGTYDIRVVPSGQTEPVLLDLAGTQFEAGVFYFIAATGTMDAPDVLVEGVSVERLNQESNADIMGGDDMSEANG